MVCPHGQKQGGGRTNVNILQKGGRGSIFCDFVRTYFMDGLN